MKYFYNFTTYLRVSCTRRNLLLFLAIFLALNLLVVVVSIEEVDENHFCRPEQLYNPYVEIFKVRAGVPVFRVDQPSFIDLRSYYGYRLCINGPAYVYDNLKHRYNLTTSEQESIYFVNTTFKFYEHECFIINRPANVTVFVGKQDQNNDGSSIADRASFHRVPNVPTGPMENDFAIHNSTRRVFGVTILGKMSDYRQPSLHQFSGAHFTHNLNNLLVSSSFAAVAPSEWKCHDDFTNTTLFLKATGQPHDICTGSEDSPPTPFDSVFKRGHFKLEYGNCWEVIPMDSPIVTTTAIGSLNSSLLAPDRLNGSARDRIGRIINPVYFGQYAQSSNKKGAMPTDELDKPAGNYSNNKFEHDFPEDFDPTLDRPYATYKFDLIDCVQPPDLNTSCEAIKAKTDKATTPEQLCKLLQSILEVDKVAVDGSPIMSTGPIPTPPPAKNGTDPGWRVKMLELIGKVFSRTCNAISERSVTSVTKIMEIYLEEKGAEPPKREHWNYITIALDHCLNGTVPMQFKQAINEGVLNSDEYRMANDKRRQAIRKVATQVYVKRKDESFSELYYYEEAAEVDYIFNAAVDSQWKIFATVLGYCQQFFTIQKATTLMLFYSMFKEDFLQPIQDVWVDHKANNLLESIIGDLINNNQMWLDFCLEGAYVSTDCEEYRCVRPVQINLLNLDGTPNGDGDTNYFITYPKHV